MYEALQQYDPRLSGVIAHHRHEQDRARDKHNRLTRSAYRIARAAGVRVTARELSKKTDNQLRIIIQAAGGVLDEQAS